MIETLYGILPFSIVHQTSCLASLVERRYVNTRNPGIDKAFLVLALSEY
jgi:hypothetical protein